MNEPCCGHSLTFMNIFPPEMRSLLDFLSAVLVKHVQTRCIWLARILLMQSTKHFTWTINPVKHSYYLHIENKVCLMLECNAQNFLFAMPTNILSQYSCGNIPCGIVTLAVTFWLKLRLSFTQCVHFLGRILLVGHIESRRKFDRTWASIYSGVCHTI